ncbi:MAG: hypothetical protein ABIJ56_03070 [Pseudomonadota bacterium]
MALMLAGLGRSTAAPLIPHAGGFIARALRQAEDLLGRADENGRDSAKERIAREKFRKDLADPDIHDSWFVEPFRNLPPQVTTSLLSMVPPKYMRIMAAAVEDRLEVSLGKVTLDEDAAPLVRQWAMSLLPPSGGRAKASVLPAELRKDPLAWFSRRPFTVGAPMKDPAVKSMLRKAGKDLREACAGRNDPAGLSDSLACCSLALCFRPEEAAGLALKIDCRPGRSFLQASKMFSLFVDADSAAGVFEEFMQYCRL